MKKTKKPASEPIYGTPIVWRDDQGAVHQTMLHIYKGGLADPTGRVPHAIMVETARINGCTFDDSRYPKEAMEALLRLEHKPE